jgi:hypothetical protein
MNKIYIYLANRSKNGIKLLANITLSQVVMPTRIKDVSSLGLNSELEFKINSILEKEKMNWELFLESAASYKDLKISLKNRGYFNLPMFTNYLVVEDNSLVVNKIQSKYSLNLKNGSFLPSMIRKTKN